MRRRCSNKLWFFTKVGIVITFLLVVYTIYLQHASSSSSLVDYSRLNPKQRSRLLKSPLPDPFDKSGAFLHWHVSKVNEVPDSKGKIDWEDRIMSAREALRQGPGEQGKAVVTTEEENQQHAELRRLSGYNAFAGDQVSLARSLPDIRHKDCQMKRYLKNLPTVSIIIPFYEEHFSSLMRTVISSLHRAPPELVKEVILVDDGSSHKDFLQKPLDDYLAKTFPDGKVKLIRSPKRQGLIRTRLLGAAAAQGEVLLFLDAHCEPLVNYLPPLLEPIAQNYKTVTCPFIDVINDDDMDYHSQDEGARGVFAWDFYYKRLSRLPGDDAHPAEPFESPVMAGGLFAISKRWFDELGGYDSGLFIWGGEQYELSFKLWMCGGQMYDIPCSRIGHIYRASMPFGHSYEDPVNKNHRRVVDVWMDDVHKQFVYKRNKNIADVDPGDISEQLAVRERLHCQNFQWFLDRVAPDLTKKYPMELPKPAIKGKIWQMRDTGMKYCLNVVQSAQVLMAPCDKNSSSSWSFTYQDEVRSNDLCLDFGSSLVSPAKSYHCHGSKGHQQFKISWANHGQDKNPLQIQYHDGAYCLQFVDDSKLIFANCDANSSAQLWNWDGVENYSKEYHYWSKVLHLEGY